MTKNPLPHLAKRLAILTTAMLLLNCGLAAERKTENLILITLDGVRYQELFGGLDLEILKATIKDGKPEDTKTYKRFWADTPKERREKLMPFFWGEWMQRHGSVAGNPQKGSVGPPGQPAAFFLSRLLGNPHRPSEGRPHHQQRQGPEPQPHRARVSASQTWPAAKTGRRVRLVGRDRGGGAARGRRGVYQRRV